MRAVMRSAMGIVVADALVFVGGLKYGRPRSKALQYAQ